jgi:hypothetical protein
LIQFLFLTLCFVYSPALAQYQTDPTHLYPASSNTAPGKKTPPKNKVISTTDKQKAGIPLHKADRFYQLKGSTPVPIQSNNTSNRPVTVWKNVKRPKYSSLYQDPSK